MKKLFPLAAAVLLLAACNTETNEAEPAAGAETAPSTIEYPYTPENPYRNWQMGSEENTVVAMKALKAWEVADFDGLGAQIGDSLEVTFDGFKAKMSRDSAVSFLKTAREGYKNVTITMQDWESVVSADKTAEYVTMWYKQTWTDNKGVTDSQNVVDDCKMLNGKMVELDEKVQRFPAAN